MKFDKYVHIANPVEFCEGQEPFFVLFDHVSHVPNQFAIQTVQFEITNDQIIAIQKRALDLIDETEQELCLQHNQKLQQLEEQRQSLLAIEHKS